MTQTKSRRPLLLIVGVAVGVSALLMVRAQGGSEPLPQTKTVQCQSKTVEVEYSLELTKNRPIKIHYGLLGQPPTTHEVTVNQWIAADIEVECGTTAFLTVHAQDVWGGDTTCRIAVDGVDQVEHHTRRREVCSVSVRLVA